METPHVNYSFPQFSFFKKTIFNLYPYKNATPEGIFKYINSTKYAKEQTDLLRNISDKNQFDNFKKNSFDYACFSGTFSKRNEAGLIAHSGLLCIDFDHITHKKELRELLPKDPKISTVLLFTSPSGTGLKWIVKIDLNQGTHLQNFQAIEKYIFLQYQIKIDSSGKDVSRPCFLPYDPECYFNPAPDEKYFNIADLLTVETTATNKATTSPAPISKKSPGKQKTIDEIVKEIEARQIDLTPTQSDWIKAGFALAVGFGEAGRGYFQRICRFWQHYDPADCDKQYDICLRGKREGIKKGSFFWMAKNAGIEI